LQAADENRILFLASALAFDALLAAIPFVLLLLTGLNAVLTAAPDDSASTLGRILESILPPRPSGEVTRFLTAESLLASVAQFGQRVSALAVLAFVWFSTRAFASVRIALSHIYDVSLRQVERSFLVGVLLGKVRDIILVVFTLGLLLLSTGISLGLRYATQRGEARVPGGELVFSWFGRAVGEVLAFAIILALFLVLYRFGSVRRIRTRAALLASCFAAVAFEVARRIFALYLAEASLAWRPSADAEIGALLLFVLWLYYSCLVFLLGGVVAETWELRHLQHRQRTILD
jgi:membrane protein